MAGGGVGCVLLLHHAIHAGQSGQLGFQQVFIGLVQLETLAAAEEGAVLEHVDGVRMEGPVGPFARSVRPSGHFEETVVEGQVVSQRILPPLSVLPVVRETFHDVAIDIGQREHPLRRRQDGHGRQGDVRIWRLLIAVALATRARHFFFRSKVKLLTKSHEECRSITHRGSLN